MSKHWNCRSLSKDSLEMFLIAKYGPTTCHITPEQHSCRYGRESETEVALIETKSDVDRVSSHIESHIQWKEERGGGGQVVAGFFKGFQEIVARRRNAEVKRKT